MEEYTPQVHVFLLNCCACCECTQCLEKRCHYIFASNFAKCWM